MIDHQFQSSLLFLLDYSGFPNLHGGIRLEQNETTAAELLETLRAKSPKA